MSGHRAATRFFIEKLPLSHWSCVSLTIDCWNCSQSGSHVASWWHTVSASADEQFALLDAGGSLQDLAGHCLDEATPLEGLPHAVGLPQSPVIVGVDSIVAFFANPICFKCEFREALRIPAWLVKISTWGVGRFLSHGGQFTQGMFAGRLLIRLQLKTDRIAQLALTFRTWDTDQTL